MSAMVRLVVETKGGFYMLIRYPNLSKRRDEFVVDKLTLILRFSASISGLTFSKLAFGGIVPLSSAKTTLMRPANPLAPSRWPIFDLTEPLQCCQSFYQGRIVWDIELFTYTSKGSQADRYFWNTFPIARASFGSPVGVPVP